MNPYFGEIYHYGIKGQKWGVRRYQNADMTWTEAGKERYGRNGTLAKARREKAAKESKSNKTITKLGSTKSEIDLATNFKNRSHDVNTNDAQKFITKVSSDILIPGNQINLPSDLYRGYKAFSSKIKTKVYANQRKNEPIDEETGFPMKTISLSEREDIKRVNPEYNDFNSNTKSNCVLCTTTCEMRNRGYDVVANKAGEGYSENEIGKFFDGYKSHEVSNKEKMSIDDGRSFARKTIESIERSQPDGSRGNLGAVWTIVRVGNIEFRSGHSMYYKINNGKLVLYDGQSGKIYRNPENVLKNAQIVTIGRLDNLKFNKNGIKEACR